MERSTDITDASILDGVLHLDRETSILEAYRWDAPGGVPVFFVFADTDFHVVTLDEHEKPFRMVRTKSQERRVAVLTDDEIAMYCEDAMNVLKFRRGEKSDA